jgi:hypothetical protein
VDARIRRAPTVRPGVDLDLGRQFGVLEGLLRTFFSFGER